MNQIDFMSIFFGIILTYGIGLLPALFIRYVVFRRAISKPGAIVICIIWFLIWSVHIFALRVSSGEEPRLSGGYFFMILISYYILSNGYVKRTKKTKNRDNNLRLTIHCPQCGRSLKGATKDMIGDIGVCPKCKAEFMIEENNSASKQASEVDKTLS
jgi:hypothetical protein